MTETIDRGIVRDPYAAIDLMYVRGLPPDEAARRCTYSAATLHQRLRKRRRWSTESWEQWRQRVDCNWLLEATRLPEQEDRDWLLSWCYEHRSEKGVGMDFIRLVAQASFGVDGGIYALLPRLGEILRAFADPVGSVLDRG